MTTNDSMCPMSSLWQATVSPDANSLARHWDYAATLRALSCTKICELASHSMHEKGHVQHSRCGVAEAAHHCGHAVSVSAFIQFNADLLRRHKT